MALTGYPALTGFPLATRSNLAQIDATAQLKLGSIYGGLDALGNFAEYVYLAGVASTIVGSVVVFDELGVSALLTVNGGAAGVGFVAVALALTVAGTFGWYGVTGTFPTDVVANTADNAKLGRETTDGKVGDGFTAGDQIIGMVSRAATTAAAVVNCQYNRPFVGVNVA